MCDDRQGNRSRLEISIKVKKLLSPDAIPGKVIYLNDSEAKKIPLFLDKINYISNYENKPHAPFNQVPTIRFSQESESISPPWQEGNKGKKGKTWGKIKANGCAEYGSEKEGSGRKNACVILFQCANS